MNFSMEKDDKVTQEDFQNKLWQYLEEKGAVLDLKTHIRQQLITILKDANLGKESIFDQKFKRNLSPKYKAVNLLIADYLLHQGYQYALSIFSSEDPTLSTIADRTRVTKFHSNHNQMTTFKFIDSDLFDILESLGFASETGIAKEIQEDYAHSISDNPLLLCLFKCLSKKSLKYDSKHLVFDNVNLAEIKASNNMSFEKTKNEEDIIEKAYLEMKIAFDSELQIFKESEKNKYTHLIEAHDACFKSQLEELRVNFENKKSQLKKKFINKLKLEQEKSLKREQLREAEIEKGLQEDLNKEKQRLSEEFRLMVDNKNVTSETLIELQQSSLEIALKAVQHQSSRLRRREERLNRKMSKLIQNSNKEMISFACQVSSDTENCLSENVIYKADKGVQTNNISKTSIGCQININCNNVTQTTKMSVASQANHIENFTRFESIGCQTELHGNEVSLEMNTIGSEEINSCVMKQPDTLNSNLKFENTYLKVYNHQHRQHIQDLIKKQTSLFKELKAANSEITNLSSQLTTLKSVINTKSAKEVIEISQRNRISNTPVPKTLKKKSFETSDCEISSIKKTLQSLEKESEEFVKSFNNFKRRQSETKSPVFKTPMKEVILKMPTLKPNFESYHNIQTGLKDMSTHTYNYLNHLYFDESLVSSNDSNLKRVYGSAMNLSNDVLQNYIDTSRQYSNYDVENPKAFADQLIRHNISKSIEDIPSYCKTNFKEIFNTKHNLDDNASLAKSPSSIQSRDFDYLLSSRSDVINAEKKNASFESRRNSLLRRWSLPSLLYKKSPLSHRLGNRSPDKLKLIDSPETKNRLKFNDYLKRRLFANDEQSHTDKAQNKEYTNTRIAHIKAINERIQKEIFSNEDSKNNSSVVSKNVKNSMDNINLNEARSFTDNEPINFIANASKTLTNNGNNMVDEKSANSTFVESTNKTAVDFFDSLNLSNINDNDLINCDDNEADEDNGYSEKAKIEMKTNFEDVITINSHFEISNRKIDYPLMKSSEGNGEFGTDNIVAGESNSNQNIVSDETSINELTPNKRNSTDSSVVSEEILVPSSLEMTDHSHISIPNFSEENDSFWK